ncbi:hypothetical protein J6590_068607 [Homalodisca vitripennis]|nr:hypothetical protein J6590_068607 [Homalodisca vitripennis]
MKSLGGACYDRLFRVTAASAAPGGHAHTSLLRSVGLRNLSEYIISALPKRKPNVLTRDDLILPSAINPESSGGSGPTAVMYRDEPQGEAEMKDLFTRPHRRWRSAAARIPLSTAPS